MLIQILILLAGLVLVVFGADYLVDGASNIARRAGLSEFMIGLTIVGIGTSMPELVVSFVGAIQGNADISIGNVVGSNIFNVLLILGLTALIRPLEITPTNRIKDIPLNLGVTLLLVLVGFKMTLFGLGQANALTRLDGIVFLAIFAFYMYHSFKSDKPDREDMAEPERKLGWSILMVVGGLSALIIGGRLFVNAATAVARLAGLSDAFIAITILAGGTSMPELATCVVAAFKKRGQMALGNIIGSNISNILLILGGSAVIHPLSFSGVGMMDIGVLVLSALLICAGAYLGKRHHLGRITGMAMLLCEAVYFILLLRNL